MKKTAQFLFPVAVCLSLAILKGTFARFIERPVYAEAAVPLSVQADGHSPDMILQHTKEKCSEESGIQLQKAEQILVPSEENPMRNCLRDMADYPVSHLTAADRAGEDYGILLRIVEAEAGGERMEGKILVANVILNRVNDPEFPGTVKDVVYQVVGGYPQFAPAVDGRINLVTVSKDTEEAVNRALDGENRSMGALYFMARDQADPNHISWFEDNLTWLFSCGGHDFYR